MKRTFLSILFVLTLLHPSLVYAAPIKRVFILAGQSNMVRNFDNMEAALKRNYGPETMVIKAAVSGSSITQWQPGQPDYESAVSKTVRAKKLGYVISGILFFQGEADAKKETSKSWGMLFVRFIDNFSRNTEETGIPVVYARLGKTPAPSQRYPYWREVREQQNQIAAMYPQYRMIETYDLGPYESGPHYHDNCSDPAWNGAGYKEITARFMLAIKKIVR